MPALTIAKHKLASTTSHDSHVNYPTKHICHKSGSLVIDFMFSNEVSPLPVEVFASITLHTRCGILPLSSHKKQSNNIGSVPIHLTLTPCIQLYWYYYR